MRVFALLFLLSGICWGEWLSPLKPSEVPPPAAKKAPAHSAYYRLEQLHEMFCCGPGGWRILHRQVDGSYRVLCSGKEAIWKDGPYLAFDWFRRPAGAGFVIYRESGSLLQTLVFPKGTLARPVSFTLSTAESYSSIGGLEPRAGYDERGVFCLENWTSSPDGESELRNRFYWNGKGFAER